jgi:hypothetical protein
MLLRADTSTAVPFNQRILVSRYLTRQLTVLSCPSPSRLVVDLQNKSPAHQKDGSISWTLLIADDVRIERTLIRTAGEVVTPVYDALELSW